MTEENQDSSSQRLLHAILTFVTAGPGLGFNRAVVFLPNEDNQELVARMAVGPATAEEAHVAWSELSNQRSSLGDLLRSLPHRNGGFHGLVEGVRLPLVKGRVPSGKGQPLPPDPLARAFQTGQVVKVDRAEQRSQLPESLRDLLDDSDAVCVPLVGKGGSLGLIVADNAFNHRPVDDGALTLLELFGLLAGLALESARGQADSGRQARQLEDTLRDLRKIQEQLLRTERLATLGEVIARVSHEIRNPLATIGGFARALTQRPRDPERVKRDAGVIVSEVEKLEALLAEMLDFSSPRRPRLEPVDVNDLISALAQLRMQELEQRDIRLELSLAPDPPLAQADRGQLERVLLNLWQNAVQAMEDIEPGKSRKLTIRTWSEGEMAKVAFSDTGRGISQEILPRIFAPFFTTKYSGSGLGLAVLKKILDDHGGGIDVQTAEDRGTTFTVALPLAEREQWQRS